MAHPRAEQIAGAIHALRKQAKPAATGPLGTLPGAILHNPLKIGILYIVCSIYFVLALAISGQIADATTSHVALFSHISVPVLVLGLAIFPQRIIWLPAGTFAFCFLLTETVSMRWSMTDTWSAVDMANGLMIASLSGAAGGFVGHSLLRAFDAGRPYTSPERAALAGGVIAALVSALLGGLALWFDVHDLSSRPDVFTMEALLFQRSVQLGLLATGAIMAFLNLPDRIALPEMILIVWSFVALGVLSNAGYSILPQIDAPVLALLVLTTRPVHQAVGGVILGLTAFILLTGLYVDLPMDMSAEDLKIDLMTNLLFVLMVIIAIHRSQQTRMDRIRQQTLGRMTRAQELARFGYFLYDASLHLVWLDPLAQRILNMGPSGSEDEFLLRVHPEDRDGLSEACSVPDDAGRSFSFRFAIDGLWRPECIQNHFTGFARYERGSAGQVLTYGIVVDVSEEHKQEEHLRLVLAELSERQGQQTQLFSMISHELRTPAAIISMLADELDEGRSWSNTGPQMRAVLDQLLSILRDMRQTVRPEQNLPIHIESFLPEELASSVRDAFRSMAQARGIDIHLRMGEGSGELRATDKVRLNQTLSNLVKNAILHSQATEILIGYTEEAGDLGIWTVGDNGRNIPEAQREKLFHPFARAVDSSARVDGSGLGLYIAKGAIELLGGTIDYVEKHMSGAEFRIVLPMRLSDASGGLVPSLPQRDIDLSQLHALLVEDSETMGSLLVARLSKIFAEVKWLRDGASGLAWAGLNNPDVVISDLFMPGLGGDEMARKLRSSGYDRPIIGMTATDIGEDVERFRKSGADAVITKPLRPQDLQAALARLL